MMMYDSTIYEKNISNEYEYEYIHECMRVRACGHALIAHGQKMLHIHMHPRCFGLCILMLLFAAHVRAIEGVNVNQTKR